MGGTPASTTEAVASLLSVMRDAAQPFRISDPDKPYASQTIWRTLADLTNGIYVFESTMRPNIVWARLDGLDLSEGAPVRKLDLAGDTGLEGGLVGDVTSRFAESPPMQFLRTQLDRGRSGRALAPRAIEHIPAGDRVKSRAEAKAEPARRRKILIGWPPNRPRSPHSAGGGRVARDTSRPTDSRA